MKSHLLTAALLAGLAGASLAAEVRAADTDQAQIAQLVDRFKGRHRGA